jgi:hypothetical protein
MNQIPESRSKLREFASFLVALFLSFLGLELAVRIYSPREEQIEISCTDTSYTHCSSSANSITSLTGFSEQFFNFAGNRWKLLPYRKMVVSSWKNGKQLFTYQTNSLGLRNAELSSRPVQKILLLGDSVTFGFRTKEAETFARILDVSLNTDSNTVEIVNAGVPSNDFAAYRAELDELIMKVKPSVVVVNTVLNDMRPCCSVRMLRPIRLLQNSMLAELFFEQLSFLLSRNDPSVQFSAASKSAITLWRAQAENFISSWSASQNGKGDEFAKHIRENSWHFGLSWSEDAWNAFAQPQLQAMKDIASSAGVSLAVVQFPIEKQITEPTANFFPQQSLKQICERLELPLLDLTSAFSVAHSTSPLPLFTDGLHLTPHGNQVVAEALASFLPTLLSGSVIKQ